LFAVGTAGYAVASSFNKMILGGGVEGVLAGLLAALLLFLGHALNLILCAMGVLVHGVRLNTLEFSSHIGMAWTGLPYRPFQRINRKQSEP
jgi:V/A-type H+-transporting ATPase subunit I